VVGLKLQGGVAFLTAEEMAEADRYAIEVLGISVDSLMENAGTKTAEVARGMLGGDVRGKKVEVLVGRGNNGGDGLVAARHLHNWDCEVSVVLGEDRSTLRDVPARQLSTVEKMGIEIVGADATLESDLLIDALLGYGSRGSPREPLSGLIRRTNSSKGPVLAVDIPSGLDATTGEPGEPSMSAKATVTFGLPKTGFLGPGARALIGELYVADISLPRAIYEKYSSRGIFAKGSLVRIW
jgi:hydroxyethylthiazole kinase-like uncharacterized protein yjeF